MDSSLRGRSASRWAFPLLVAALLAAWTLFCAGGWLLVQAGGALLTAGSGWLSAWPEVAWWAQWSVRLLETSGAALLGVGWAFGALGIVFGAWIGRRLWRAVSRATAGGDPRAARAPAGGGVVPGEGADAAIEAHPALSGRRRPAND